MSWNKTQFIMVNPIWTMDKFHFAFMVHMGIYHSKLCVVLQKMMPRAIKLCHVPQFGGDGYQVTKKPIEPQSHLSKRNKIAEFYG